MTHSVSDRLLGVFAYKKWISAALRANISYYLQLENIEMKYEA